MYSLYRNKKVYDDQFKKYKRNSIRINSISLKLQQIIKIRKRIMNQQLLSQEAVVQLNRKSSNLKPQSSQDISDLSQLSPQVMSRQATLNIGTIGHVSHGKSTLVKAISGVKTTKFKNEQERNITIKLGYANAKIYKCPKCPSPECYQSYSSFYDDSPPCPNSGCQENLQLIRHVSFCDCPGHDIFLSTMLTGAAVMDAAMVLVAANVECPQPQTAEHLLALQIMKLEHTIVLQNKVDIVFNDPQKLKTNYKQIRNYMKSTRCKNSPIIPISAQQGYNIDAVLEAICQIPLPKRNLDVPPRMIIIRSFDVNKPGSQISSLQGGVVGGSIIEGILKVGMEVEIRPGILTKDSKNNLVCTPVKTRINSLLAENNDLLYAIPGGLIGVGLLVDPSMTRNDQMVGNVLGAVGQLPDIYQEIDIKFYSLSNLLGAKKQIEEKVVKIKKVSAGQVLKFNIGSNQTPGKVIKVTDDLMKVRLSLPVCTSLGQKIAYSRRFQKKFRLIGYGEIKAGLKIQISN